MFDFSKTEKCNATRGYGVLENFLARRRSSMADSLIPARLRKGKIIDIGCGTNPLFLKKTLFHEKYGLDKAGSDHCFGPRGKEAYPFSFQAGINPAPRGQSGRNCDAGHKIPGTDHGDIHLVNQDFEKNQLLPFKENFFHVVTMLAVIEHIQPQNVFSLLCETKRVLKPNGIIILTTPAAWTDRLLRTMAKFKIVSSVEIEDHKDTYTKNKLENMLVTSGYAKDNVRSGYFECLANIWVMARK